jgi:hypothetical protein
MSNITDYMVVNPHGSPGEAAEGGKDLRRQAGEIMACEYLQLAENASY